MRILLLPYFCNSPTSNWIYTLSLHDALPIVFGCCTSVAAAIGLVLVVNYGLAVQWQGSAQQGFHYMLITTLVVILGARAGRVWGVDGWVRAHRPGGWLRRVPLG